MAKKKIYKSKTEKKTVNEPTIDYEGKRIHFFKSLEEMEEDNYKWLATLSPIEHFTNATELIKRIFAKDLKKKPTIGSKIYFV